MASGSDRPAAGPGPAAATDAAAAPDWPPWLVGAAAAVLIVDRLTKLLVVHDLPLGVAVWPGSPISLRRIDNRGAAFGLLPEAQWLFVAVALFVIVYIATHWRPLAGESALLQAALGMLLGGAVANAFDRVVHGYVVDFVSVRDFATFNLADSGITIGVVIVIARLVLGVGQGGPPR
ncbi:MAG TPA: signal peptidase II [Candidatus Micrarchaeia archaeon]|nr:signal peptidase II [Candidatus Micrarchaeia archaeon]